MSAYCLEEDLAKSSSRCLAGAPVLQGFYFGREVPSGSPEAAKPLHGPNQWPDPQLLPRYREVTQAYFAALYGLGMR